MNQLPPTSIFESNSPILLNNHNQLYVQTSIKEIDKFKGPYLTFLSNNKALESEHDNFQQPIAYHNISADVNHSSSNGLLNIISNQENENKQILNKISYSPPITPIKQQLPIKTEILKRQNLNLLELKDSNCNVCSRFSKLFCICNVSKTALNKLYKNCSGFNSFLFETNHNKRYQYERNQRLLASENESKVFEVL